MNGLVEPPGALHPGRSGAPTGEVEASTRGSLLRLLLTPPFLVFGAIALLAILAPVVAPYDPVKSVPADKLLPPSPRHWMGTDSYGFDILSRVLYATRTDLPVAIGSVVVAIALGLPLGVLAAYLGGWVDNLLMRLTEIGQSFPQILFAMVIFAALGNSFETLLLILIVLHLPVYIRMVRSVMLPLREAEFILAARLVGNGTVAVVLRHALPNTLVPVFSQFSISAAFAIQLVAGLSFIGLGVRVPQPEWGSMINVGAHYVIFGQWWPSTFPGLAVFLTAYALTGIGNQLRQLSQVHG